MPLPAGTVLGQYLLVAQIGAGGMGVVYKAMDLKLDRLVAIKVLPEHLASNPGLVARFRREARTLAALSHPNVLGIHDFGQEGEILYVVMELLEGEDLRARVEAGGLQPRKAMEIATQVALGLAAAHEAGIIHRDIKPENIFLCKDGRVKLLDFGLAKPVPKRSIRGQRSARQLTKAHAGRDAQEAQEGPAAFAPGSGPAHAETFAGKLMGTLGYMSPEQLQGQTLDARSDIFSFGVVLYELLTGKQAFHKDSAEATMTAILEEDPAAFTATKGAVAPALERLIGHCLEKQPGERFQAIRDVAFALQNLTYDTGAVTLRSGRKRRPLLLWRGLSAALGLSLALGGAWAFWLRPMDPPPTFQRLEFTAGTVESAFFGPDGKTIYFSARLQGLPPAVFVIHPDGLGPTPLGIQDALLLGVSGASELALLRHPRRRQAGRYQGLLAQTSGGGGSVKELLANVSEASWDGQSMALLAQDDQGQLKAEFPAGRTVLTVDGGSRGLKFLRVSRSGGHLALVQSDNNLGQTQIVTYDRAGTRRVLFTKRGDSLAQTLTGLAWGPGDQLWYSEWQGDQTAVFSLSPRGRQRLVWRGEGVKQLLDIAPNGNLLLANQQVRRGVYLQRAGVVGTQVIALQGGTQAQGLSADGRTLLLLESPAMDGGTAQDLAYVLKLDGSGAMKLAKGNPMTLTPDGSALQLAIDFMGPKDLDTGVTAAFRAAGLDPETILNPQAEPVPFILFMPTGPGRPRLLPLPKGFEGNGTAFLLGDGHRVIFQGQEQGEFHWYLWNPGQDQPRAFSPPGLGTVIAGLTPLSPDETRFIATGDGKSWFIVPVQGKPEAVPQPIQGIRPGERVIGWSRDGKALYLRPELSVLPVVITRLHLASGARQQVHRFMPPDPSGHQQIRTVWMTPDAQTFAFTYDRKLSELFEVKGLK